jgi:hypothetical protein
MSIVAVVFGFFLHLLHNWKAFAHMIINKWCPRTGKRQLETQLPLSKLRIALELMLNFTVIQNSG